METVKEIKKSASETLEETLENYQKELREDIKLEQLNLSDKVTMVPIIKHKWVSRLMQHKLQLKKIQAFKKKRVTQLAKNLDVVLTTKVADNVTKNDVEYAKLQDVEDMLEVIIEYLEKVEKITGGMSWDCRNLIDLQKMETT